MTIDSPKKPFSKRYGYKVQPKEITIWEDAPENLRHFVLDTAVEMGYGPYPLRDAICSVLHARPDPSNWSEYPNVWGKPKGWSMDATGSGFMTSLRRFIRVSRRADQAMDMTTFRHNVPSTFRTG